MHRSLEHIIIDNLDNLDNLLHTPPEAVTSPLAISSCDHSFQLLRAASGNIAFKPRTPKCQPYTTPTAGTYGSIECNLRVYYNSTLDVLGTSAVYTCHLRSHLPKVDADGQMVGPPSILSSSATPTQKSAIYAQQSVPYSTVSRTSFDRGDGLQPTNNGLRGALTSQVSFGPRGSSLAPSPAPGSFSSNMRSHLGSRTASGNDVNAGPRELERMERMEEDDGKVSEQLLFSLREALNREMKIKEGSENMLEALNSKKAKQTKEQRQKVEAELNSSNTKIKELRAQITEFQRPRPKLASTPTRGRMDSLFQNNNGQRSPQSASRSIEGSEVDEPTESPTYALAEVLQALEVEGLTPDYYVGHANSLVELFKRHPTLKYDLVWSIFGLRLQVMLLSESREVVAAGYRMTRYAISDLSSLHKIRGLNTDYLVVL